MLEGNLGSELTRRESRSGCLGSVYANDKHGRPVAIMLGCVLCVLAAGLTAGSVHIAMFIMGRLVMGLGVGNLLVLVPLYQSEIVPYNHRGLLVGLHVSPSFPSAAPHSLSRFA